MMEKHLSGQKLIFYLRDKCKENHKTHQTNSLIEKNKIDVWHSNSNIWCVRHIIGNATYIRSKAIENAYPQENL